MFSVMPKIDLNSCMHETVGENVYEVVLSISFEITYVSVSVTLAFQKDEY